MDGTATAQENWKVGHQRSNILGTPHLLLVWVTWKVQNGPPSGARASTLGAPICWLQKNVVPLSCDGPLGTISDLRESGMPVLIWRPVGDLTSVINNFYRGNISRNDAAVPTC